MAARVLPRFAEELTDAELAQVLAIVESALRRSTSEPVFVSAAQRARASERLKGLHQYRMRRRLRVLPGGRARSGGDGRPRRGGAGGRRRA